jgi:hypothetical protein
VEDGGDAAGSECAILYLPEWKVRPRLLLSRAAILSRSILSERDRFSRWANWAKMRSLLI